MKISVIIPVFNSEKYLERCLDSICSQSYTNWEVIAVDDGSVDKSLEILKRFQREDKRFQVIHQQNAGAGEARNHGLQMCRAGNPDGYIVFIDSDDYIEPDYFYLLSLHNEDVVFIDVVKRNSNGRDLGKERMSKYLCCTIDDILRKQMTGNIPWGGWRKAYKAKLLLDNGVAYSNHKVGEEAVFSFKALFYSKSIGFIDKPVYSYVLHEGSLSATRLDDPWGEVVDNLKKVIIEMDRYDQYANTINAFYVSATAVSLRRLVKNYAYKDYVIKAHDRIAIMDKKLDPDYAIDKKSLSRIARSLLLLIKKRYVFVIYLLGKLY